MTSKAEHGDGVALLTGDTGSGKEFSDFNPILQFISGLYMYRYFWTGKSQLLPVFYFWVNKKKVTDGKKKIVLCEPTRIATSMIFDRVKSIGAVCGLLSDHFGMKIHKGGAHYKECSMGVTSAGINSKPDAFK